MAEGDFDLDQLAAYLHIGPAQVQRLVERGKLPGRRVGGQWRFSPGEIHHWLEERIGISSDEELAQMEGQLRRDRSGVERAAVSVAQLLPLEAIAVPLAARTKSSVITSMCELAARTGWLWEPAKMAEAVRAREELASTALECGVALLHPRRPQPNLLDRPFLALGRTEGGIPFGAPGGGLTDIFVLILSREERGHLQALARLSRLVGDAELLQAIRQARSAAEVHDLIAARETALD